MIAAGRRRLNVRPKKGLIRYSYLPCRQIRNICHRVSLVGLGDVILPLAWPQNEGTRCAVELDGARLRDRRSVQGADVDVIVIALRYVGPCLSLVTGGCR